MTSPLCNVLENPYSFCKVYNAAQPPIQADIETFNRQAKLVGYAKKMRQDLDIDHRTAEVLAHSFALFMHYHPAYPPQSTNANIVEQFYRKCFRENKSARLDFVREAFENLARNGQGILGACPNRDQVQGLLKFVREKEIEIQSANSASAITKSLRYNKKPEESK